MNNVKKFLFFLSLFAFQYSFSENLKLVFRYDDFVLKNDSLNKQLIDVFVKNKIPIVLGIVPYGSDRKVINELNLSFFDELKQGVNNGLIEIALHGFNHSRVSKNGEFDHVQIEEQFYRMKLGKAYLDSLFQYHTISFIPPWNAYDENTLIVMEKIGMKIISSSMTVNQALTNDYIVYYPHTIDDPKGLVQVIKRNVKRDGVIVLMFHSYDFSEKFSVDDLESLLIDLDRNYDIQFTTFRDLLNQSEKSDSNRFKSNLEVNLLSKLLNMSGVLYEKEFVLLIRVLNLAIYILLVIFSFYVPIMFSPKSFYENSTKFFITVILILVFTGFSVWFRILGPLKLLLILIMISFVSSTIMSLYKNKFNLEKVDKNNLI